MPDLPVVFVPGQGGSYNLLVLLDWRGPTLDGWGFPPFLDYGQRFLAGLQAAGYVRDQTLFVAFYDWRKSVDDSAAAYLIPWIDRAVAASGKGQVVLVGHSMGGLVARSYIQSNAYRGDVARLITLGAPHRGAAEAYRAWEAGQLPGDSLTTVALNCYLWYLEHAHPFQTGLDRLKAIQTQALGIRDLLPIDDYLYPQGGPRGVPKPEAQMNQRNLVGEILNSPGGIDALVRGVPSITTISGTGYPTVSAIIVGAPTPPSFVDGAPIATGADLSSDGDSTVPLASAQLDVATNVGPLNILHGNLPDQAVDTVLAALDQPVPPMPPVQPPEPKLVVMTASPVDLSIDPPVATAGPAPAGVSHAVRAYNHGHDDERLNMAVFHRPATGEYRLHLDGLAAGTFALGAMLVGVETVPGARAGVPASQRHTPVGEIETGRGVVAAGTTLHFRLDVPSDHEQPHLSLDAEETTRDAISRIAEAAGPLPSAPGALALPTLDTMTTSPSVPGDVHRQVVQALKARTPEATEQLAAAAVVAPGSHHLNALRHVALQVVGPRNRRLAVGLAVQLRNVIDR